MLAVLVLLCLEEHMPGSRDGQMLDPFSPAIFPLPLNYSKMYSALLHLFSKLHKIFKNKHFIDALVREITLTKQS